MFVKKGDVVYTEMMDEYSFCRPYLAAGETVLWRGKPQKGHMFTAQDIFLIPFSILWCSFAIFWEATAIAGGAPFFFCLWGIPFVCVGLYLVFGRFFWAAYIRKRTAYVITNQKILRARGNRVDMLDIRNLPAMYVTARRDGSGTIRFGEYQYRGRNTLTDNHAPFMLENIAEVAKIQQILFQIQ